MRTDPGEDCPPVVVVMTALNEQRHITEAVVSVFDQDYPGPIDLVVAVGPSHDGTTALARQLAEKYGPMLVVDNPTGRTPAGLNRAIAATDPRTAIIVRSDAHAQLPPGYVSRAVADLARTGADNVGGMMIPEGTTAFERAVARAMSRRIGMGAAPFHVGGTEGPADTVYLGVFRRTILEATGGFDETFVRAQDWELNHRIRALGGVVWFDPALRVGYRPRPNVTSLARQFHGSGEWRWQIIRAYPQTASARYLAAPLAVSAIVAAAGVLVVDVLLVHSALLAVVAAAVPVAYLLLVLLAVAASGRRLGLQSLICYPIAVVTMHMAWGAGFVWAALRDTLRRLSPVRRLSRYRATRQSRYSS